MTINLTALFYRFYAGKIKRSTGFKPYISNTYIHKGLRLDEMKIDFVLAK